MSETVVVGFEPPFQDVGHEPPFDNGGLLSGGGYRIPSATLRPVLEFSPEQIATFQRVVELARRSRERDGA